MKYWDWVVINEAYLKIRTLKGWGLLKSDGRWLLRPQYIEIFPSMSEKKLLWCTASRYAEDAQLYIILYLSPSGTLLFSEAYPAEEYLRISCQTE